MSTDDLRFIGSVAHQVINPQLDRVLERVAALEALAPRVGTWLASGEWRCNCEALSEVNPRANGACSACFTLRPLNRSEAAAAAGRSDCASCGKDGGVSGGRCTRCGADASVVSAELGAALDLAELRKDAQMYIVDSRAWNPAAALALLDRLERAEQRAASHESASNMLSAWQQKADSRAARIATLEAQLAKATAHETVTALEERLAAISASKTALRERLDSAELAIVDLEAQLATERAGERFSIAEVQALRSRAHVAEGALAKRYDHTAVAKLGDTCEELRAQLATERERHEAAKAQWEASYMGLGAQLRETRETYEDVSRAHAAEVERLKDECAKRYDQIAALEAQLSERGDVRLAAEFDAVVATNAALRGENELLRGRITAMERAR